MEITDPKEIRRRLGIDEPIVPSIESTMAMITPSEKQYLREKLASLKVQDAICLSMSLAIMRKTESEKDIIAALAEALCYGA